MGQERMRRGSETVAVVDLSGEMESTTDNSKNGMLSTCAGRWKDLTIIYATDPMTTSKLTCSTLSVVNRRVLRRVFS